jgi:hypothetical protein
MDSGAESGSDGGSVLLATVAGLASSWAPADGWSSAGDWSVAGDWSSADGAADEGSPRDGAGFTIGWGEVGGAGFRETEGSDADAPEGDGSADLGCVGLGCVGLGSVGVGLGGAGASAAEA